MAHRATDPIPAPRPERPIAALPAPISAGRRTSGRPGAIGLVVGLLLAVAARGAPVSSPADPLHLTAAMQEWLRQRIPPGLTEEERARRLVSQLNTRELTYLPNETGTAADAFETGRFNCVSFSFLYVALGRELDLDAYFLREIDDRRYSREGELVVISEHMTAGVRLGTRERLLEFSFLPVPSRARFRQLSDREALALYYSNVGTEKILAGELPRAIRWMERATITAPELAEIWVNLGVARRRSGDPGGAEAAYRRAIHADPDDTRAYLNLASLLWWLGRPHAADELLDLLDEGSTRDPFACLVLGDRALKSQRLDDAERFYRRALKRNRRSAEAQSAMGELHLRRGELRKARRRLKKALERDPGQARALRLKSQLEALTPPEPPPPR